MVTRRCISFLLAMIMCSCFILSVSAEAPTGSDDFEQEGVIIQDPARIDSKGGYYFKVSSEHKADDQFIATRSTIKITAKAIMRSRNDGHDYEDSSKEFIITIYNSDTDEEVGTIEGCADNGSNSQTISVTKNQQYYMVATCSPTLKAPYYLYISGKLTNIKVVDK